MLLGGRDEESIGYFHQAIETNRLFKPHVFLGEHPYHREGLALYHLGRFNEAIQEFDKVLAIHPGVQQAREDRRKAEQNRTERNRNVDYARKSDQNNEGAESPDSQETMRLSVGNGRSGGNANVVATNSGLQKDEYPGAEARGSSSADDNTIATTASRGN